MSQPAQPVIRRWDGKAKEATIWNPHARDPELSSPNANCFIYISRGEVQRQQPSFIVPFERLVWSKCQPLIKKAAVRETHAGKSPPVPIPPRSPARQPPRSTCTLVLEAPKQHNDEEISQYHTTTRNFFAWIMDKPIVGPDPASALLALKVRMDVWRTPSVDNFVALEEYAKSHGYGDLSDVQSFMKNHLRGLAAVPLDYKLVSSERSIRSEAPRHRTNSFKNSIWEPVWWTQLRSSWLNTNSNSSHSSPISSISNISDGVAGVNADELVMSGAIPAAKDIKDPSMTRYLPMSVAVQTPAVSQSAEHSLDAAHTSPPSRLAKPPKAESLHGRNHLRTWSLPDLHDLLDGEVPSALHRQSSWVSNLCKEKTQLSTSQQQPSMIQHATPPISLCNMSQLPRGQKLSVPRHRQSTCLSRKPSPILEEDSRSVPLRPLSASRTTSSRELTNNNNILNLQGTVAELDAAGVSLEIAPVKRGLDKSITSRTAPIPNPSGTRNCLHEPLPSHSIPVCKNCWKQKTPRQQVDQMRQQLVTSRPSSARSKFSPTPRTSSNFDDIGPSQCALPRDQYLDSHLADCEEVMSRFPSLRRRSLTAKTPKRHTLHVFAGDVYDQDTSRQNSIMSDMAASHKRQNEKPTDGFGNHAFTGQEHSASPTTRNDFEGVFKERTLSLASAPGPPPNVNMSPLSKILATSGHPRNSLRLICDQPNTQEHEATAVSSASEAQDWQKPWPTNFTSVRSHVVPLDEQSPGAGSTKTMESILQGMGTLERHIPAKQSAQCIETPPRKQVLAERYDGRVPDKPTHGLKEMKSTAKRHMRNSLKMWNRNRLQKEKSSAVEYQGLVLCMDRFGNFSALPSPVESFAGDTQAFSYERSRTPLCELP